MWDADGLDMSSRNRYLDEVDPSTRRDCYAGTAGSHDTPPQAAPQRRGSGPRRVDDVPAIDVD